MKNTRKEYVSPEVNVILVDQDVITVSGDEIEWETYPEVEPGIGTPEIDL